MGPLRRTAAAVALVLLAMLPSAHPQEQQCSAMSDANVLSRGALGDGKQDDAGAFMVFEQDPAKGVIYMSRGTYRIASSITLNKPVIGASDAVFLVDPGVTLTINNQPEHPLTPFFTGPGTVLFGDGCVRSYPEWWGAKGDGSADDAPALLAAYIAAAQKGSAMLYLTKTYGLGRELQLTNKATIFAQPSAKFVSVNNNPAGLTLLEGGFGFKTVMPHFSGFSDFCARLLGSDLAAMQFQTLTNCGDAIRIEANYMETQDNGLIDRRSCLDNTVWFDRITNARYALAFRASTGCDHPNCVFQGNHFVGNAIVGGPSSGQSAAFLFSTPSAKSAAWDSNQFDIAIVTPPKDNKDYTLFRSEPESAREIIKIARLDPLPNGARVFAPSVNHQMQVTINLASQLAEGQFGLNGLLNLVTITGATTPLPGSPPLRCVTKQNNKAAFNGGRSLVGNSHRLLAVPDTDWAAGEVKAFYIFHQLATGYLYQIKCNAPAGPDGLPSLDCTQYNDNSLGNPGVPATPEEIQLYVINLTGATIPAGTEMPFKVALYTLGNPSSS